MTKSSQFMKRLRRKMAIATANRLKPAFVIVTGDLVNKAGDAAQIAEYRRIAARLNPAIPLYPVAGNHDLENTPTPDTVAAYEKTFGPDHYTFTYQGMKGQSYVVVVTTGGVHTLPNLFLDVTSSAYPTSQTLTLERGTPTDPFAQTGVQAVSAVADFGVDGFRYHFLRDVPLGADSDFSHADWRGGLVFRLRF